MSRCSNEKCSRDPLQSLDAVVVNCDGDLACCPACAEEYRKQRDHFFNHIVHSENLTKRYLLGEDV